MKPAAKAAVKKPAVKAAARPEVKPVAKPAAKPAAKKAAAPAVARSAPASAAKPKTPRKPAAKAAPEEQVREKARKSRLVRDSFTMPEHEYEVLGQVKKSCLKAGFEIKKSELLRIGVALISQLDLATLQNVLASLPQLKTGRPRKT
ncbi:MAG: hypothetical protein ABWY27_08595 [Telluria sp.]